MAPGRRSTGGLLAQARLQRGWTQGDLARRTGIAVTQLSRYETGQEVPPLSRRRRLCAVLGVTAETLLGWLDEARRRRNHRTRQRRQAA